MTSVGLVFAFTEHKRRPANVTWAVSPRLFVILISVPALVGGIIGTMRPKGVHLGVLASDVFVLAGLATLLWSAPRSSGRPAWKQFAKSLGFAVGAVLVILGDITRSLF